MTEHSRIEWTEATWNPVTGCTKVSPGCASCYIERTPAFRIAGRRFVKGHIPVELHNERLEQPLRWRKPRRIFVNSLSDLFHEDVPDRFICDVFTVMQAARQHIFQVLTKRPERMRELLLKFHGHRPFVERYPNVWLGVSVENKRMRDARIPILLKTPAAVRWISCEPLLEDIVDEVFTISLVSGWDAPPYDDKIDWVVVGGESGPDARRCDIGWIGRIVDACREYQTPVFVKQLGTYASFPNIRTRFPQNHGKGGDPAEWPNDLRVREYPILSTHPIIAQTRTVQ